MRHRFVVEPDGAGTWSVIDLALERVATFDGQTFERMTREAADAAAYALQYVNRRHSSKKPKASSTSVH